MLQLVTTFILSIELVSCVWCFYSWLFFQVGGGCAITNACLQLVCTIFIILLYTWSLLLDCQYLAELWSLSPLPSHRSRNPFVTIRFLLSLALVLIFAAFVCRLITYSIPVPSIHTQEYECSTFIFHYWCLSFVVSLHFVVGIAMVLLVIVAFVQSCMRRMFSWCRKNAQFL